MNLRPSGYEPDELPGCSTPRQFCRPSSDGLCLTRRMASKEEPPRKGGTYNRFGEDVKHGIGAKTADRAPRRPAAHLPLYGDFPQVCKA